LAGYARSHNRHRRIGIKTALFENHRIVGSVRKEHVPTLDYRRFGDWVAARLGRDFDVIGVAVPGFVDHATETVLYSFYSDWTAVNLAQVLRDATGVDRVVVMNDAEAHAYSNRHRPRPLVQLTLGSSFGLAVLDVDETFVRPRHGSLDAGRLSVRCDLSNSGAWYSLSGKGLAELERRNAKTAHNLYARLILDFAVGIAVMFQPKTIAFSGGILESLSTSSLNLASAQLALPPWYINSFGRPSLVVSDQPSLAGLFGLASAAGE
jgi:hypothetical protein